MGEEQEETGWKYLHGDVFRIPPHINLFSAMMGVGTQVGAAAAFVFVWTSSATRHVTFDWCRSHVCCHVLLCNFGSAVSFHVCLP